MPHHQPPSTGPPPAHAGSHSSVGSGSLISPLSGPMGGGSSSLKPGLAHSHNFPGSHHSGLHSSSLGGNSILPPPPGLTSSSRTSSGVPSSSGSNPSQRGPPPPSYSGLAQGPDPISRPRSTDIQVIGERFHNRGGISPEPRPQVQEKVQKLKHQE